MQTLSIPRIALITILAFSALQLPAPAEEKTARPEQEYGKLLRSLYTEVPPQPANGQYTISPTLPEVDSFWMYPAELRPGEGLNSFISRAWEEHRQQARKLLMTKSDSRSHIVMDAPNAPDVKLRGIVLRNPAAPEAYREVIWPLGRDNGIDEPWERARHYSLFLSVSFTRGGICVQQGRGYAWEQIVATGKPRQWAWSEAEAFLAALPGLLQGDPQQVEWFLPPGVDTLSAPLRKRIASGRRMLLFYADDTLPMADYWETYARMAATAGVQCLEYCSSPDTITPPEERTVRGLSPQFSEQLKQGGPAAVEQPDITLPLGN